MRTFVWIFWILAALVIGLAVGAITALIIGLSKKHKQKKQYTYQDTHTWKDVKKMTKTNELIKRKNSLVDESEASKDYSSD